MFASPAFNRLLGLGQQSRIPMTVAAQMCVSMGVAKQTDWPLATISRLGETDAVLDPGYWLQADPVHFVLQRDYFSLGPPVHLLAEESAALQQTLNQHFAADGLEFFVAEQGNWYLHLHADPQIETTELNLAQGQDTKAHALRGIGAAKWNRLLNEVQMLLHEHPVNQAREQRGELAVNSLWLSGGGVLPAQPLVAGKKLYATDALSRGLAKLTAQGLTTASVPELLSQSHEDVLLVLQTVNDIDWVELLQALKQRKISQLKVDFSIPGGVLHLQWKPLDAWKFWKKPQSLAAVLGLPEATPDSE